MRLRVGELLALGTIASTCLAACQQGPQGPSGPAGQNGVDGSPGSPGQNGSPDTGQEIIDKISGLGNLEADKLDGLSSEDFARSGPRSQPLIQADGTATTLLPLAALTTVPLVPIVIPGEVDPGELFALRFVVDVPSACTAAFKGSYSWRSPLLQGSESATVDYETVGSTYVVAANAGRIYHGRVEFPAAAMRPEGGDWVTYRLIREATDPNDSCADINLLAVSLDYVAGR